MRFHIALLFGILNSIAISLYDARDQFLWLLEAAPVLLGVAILCFTYKHYKFTTFTYGIIAFSFILILIGAHYTYSQVQFFNWLKDEFNLSRNHFDRVGHFFQGVVPAIIIREILARDGYLEKKWMNFLILFACLGISALYEIVEMLAAFVVHGATIEWFLGLQGDEWDTQKDMLMALLGAATALITLGKIHDRALKKIPLCNSRIF